MCASLRALGNRVGERGADRATKAPDRLVPAATPAGFGSVGRRNRTRDEPTVSGPDLPILVVGRPRCTRHRQRLRSQARCNPVVMRSRVRRDVWQVERRFRSLMVHPHATSPQGGAAGAREAAGNGRVRGCGGGAVSSSRGGGAGGARARVPERLPEDLEGERKAHGRIGRGSAGNGGDRATDPMTEQGLEADARVGRPRNIVSGNGDGGKGAHGAGERQGGNGHGDVERLSSGGILRGVTASRGPYRHS